MGIPGITRGAVIACASIVGIVLLALLGGWPSGDEPPSRPLEPEVETARRAPGLPDPLGDLPEPLASPDAPGESGPDGDPERPRFRVVPESAPQVADHSEPDQDQPFVEDGSGLPSARLDEDPETRQPSPVTPGRAPKLDIADLLKGGLAPISGTRELTGKRKPELSEGIPVALTGRVVEKETGKPVARASVFLRSTFFLRRIFYDHHLLEVARAETNEDGEYTVVRLNVDPAHFGKGGLVFVSATSADHSPLSPMVLKGVTPGYRNRLPDLQVSRERHTVTGLVLDYWENRPVVGGRVVATGEILPIHYPKDQRPALFLSAPEAVTDEKGRFVLENVGPGTHYLSVHGGNDCAGYVQVRVPSKGEVRIMSRQIRGRIEGRVLDGKDRPITVVRVDGGDNTTHTFADGSFVLENFRGDVVSLTFTHPDYATKVVPGVKNGEREVLVRLVERWPEVRFRVKDHATGKPVKVITVRLHFEGDEKPPLPTSPHSIARKGLHRVRVPLGVVAATVAAGGYEEQMVFLTGVQDGDVRDVVLRKE